MGRQHTNSAAAASSTASLAQEGTSQRHAHPLHTQLLLWFIIQSGTLLPPSNSCMQPPASSSTFTHTHTCMHTRTHFCSFRILWTCVVFAVMRRYHILCTQSCTSASLNGNRFSSTCTPKCFLHLHLTTTQPRPCNLHFIPQISYIVTSSKLHPDFQLTPHAPVLSPPVRMGTGRTGAGDEEGMYPGGGN